MWVRPASRGGKAILAGRVLNGVSLLGPARWSATRSALCFSTTGHWDGRGPCPFVDPLGQDVQRMDESVRQAQAKRDWDAMFRLYSFVLNHVHRNFTLIRGTVHIYYDNRDRHGECHLIYTPGSVLLARIDDTLEALRRHDPHYAPIRFCIAVNEWCEITFGETVRNAPVEWKFELKPIARQ